MKQVLSLLLLIATGIIHLSAQPIQSIPRPEFDNIRDTCDYVFVLGIGDGTTETSAMYKADIDGQISILRKYGIEYDQQSVYTDTLKAVFARNTLVIGKSKFRYIVKNCSNGVYTAYSLFKATKDLNVLLNVPEDHTFKERVEAYYRSWCPSTSPIAPIPPKTHAAWPLGIKQFTHGRTAWTKVRGGIWLVGQVGGLAGAIACGSCWSRHCTELKGLNENLKRVVYDDEKAVVLQNIIATETKLRNSKIGFGVSFFAMGLFYGLNVIDNCVWTKTDKTGVRASLSISPSINPECTGIFVTYNF